MPKTQNDDPVSLYVGNAYVEVGMRVRIRGEESPRTITYALRSREHGNRVRFKNQGEVPIGEVEWNLLPAEATSAYPPEELPAAPKPFPAEEPPPAPPLAAAPRAPAADEQAAAQVLAHTAVPAPEPSRDSGEAGVQETPEATADADPPAQVPTAHARGADTARQEEPATAAVSMEQQTATAHDIEEDIAFSGFDSARSEKKAGAITTLVRTGGGWRFVAPERVSLLNAHAVLTRHAAGTATHVVGVNQPLVVPNKSGSRYVERACAPLFTKFDGAVQRTSRAKPALFGPDAPIWKFLRDLGDSIDPQRARSEAGGVFAFEVYPALAVLGLYPDLFQRGRLLNSNPQRPAFELADWRLLCEHVSASFASLGADEAAAATARLMNLDAPTRRDQGELDALVSLLVAVKWRLHGLQASAVLGDLRSGYFVVPMHVELAEELEPELTAKKVPFVYEPAG